MDSKPSSKADFIEGMMVKRIAAAGIQLRFDKVALRLVEAVKAGVGETLPAHQSIAFTLTAPIRLPAKTAAAVQDRLRGLCAQGLSATINGNEIRARIVEGALEGMPKVIGFVHNREHNADLLLNIVETSLRES
jgi:hypothetical protein